MFCWLKNHAVWRGRQQRGKSLSGNYTKSTRHDLNIAALQVQKKTCGSSNQNTNSEYILLQ